MHLLQDHRVPFFCWTFAHLLTKFVSTNSSKHLIEFGCMMHAHDPHIIRQAAPCTRQCRHATLSTPGQLKPHGAPNAPMIAFSYISILSDGSYEGMCRFVPSVHITFMNPRTCNPCNPCTKPLQLTKSKCS